MHEDTATSLPRPRIAHCTAILSGAAVKPGSRHFAANSTFITSYVIFSCFNYGVQCNQQLEFNERNSEGTWVKVSTVDYIYTTPLPLLDLPSIRVRKFTRKAQLG
jgi:hypothetical protein